MESHGGLLSRHPSNVGPAPSLSHAVANSLRSAVHGHARRGPVPLAQWRHALRLVCEDARRSDIPIVQLLVALKQALAPLCDVFGVPHGHERTAFVNRLVTICIEEFYAQPSRGEREVELAGLRGQ